jgi:hypothetical protein
MSEIVPWRNTCPIIPHVLTAHLTQLLNQSMELHEKHDCAEISVDYLCNLLKWTMPRQRINWIPCSNVWACTSDGNLPLNNHPYILYFIAFINVIETSLFFWTSGYLISYTYTDASVHSQFHCGKHFQNFIYRFWYKQSGRTWALELYEEKTLPARGTATGTALQLTPHWTVYTEVHESCLKYFIVSSINHTYSMLFHSSIISRNLLCLPHIWLLLS